MVIRAEDRVSSVLARDESLIEVFVALSPAFERLRNAAMRRVMTRLVTVAQAARMGGVDADLLVARLNEHVGGRPAPPADNSAPAARTLENLEPPSRPDALARIAAADVVTVDVRAELRAGREPFSMIMAARRTVPDGGALCVRAIFEPVPLYAVLGRQGMAHWTERHADDDWLVWFYPDASPGAAPAADAAPAPAAAEDDVVILDVRGLEPPEPMVRTLAALETLPPGATLVQINVRVPQFLLPLLEQRGFTWEAHEQDDVVRLFIRRVADAHATGDDQ